MFLLDSFWIGKIISHTFQAEDTGIHREPPLENHRLSPLQHLISLSFTGWSSSLSFRKILTTTTDNDGICNPAGDPFNTGRVLWVATSQHIKYSLWQAGGLAKLLLLWVWCFSFLSYCWLCWSSACLGLETYVLHHINGIIMWLIGHPPGEMVFSASWECTTHQRTYSWLDVDSCPRAPQQGECSSTSGGFQPGLDRSEDCLRAATLLPSALSVGTKEAEEEEEGKRGIWVLQDGWVSLRCMEAAWKCSPGLRSAWGGSSRETVRSSIVGFLRLNCSSARLSRCRFRYRRCTARFWSHGAELFSPRAP